MVAYGPEGAIHGRLITLNSLGTLLVGKNSRRIMSEERRQVGGHRMSCTVQSTRLRVRMVPTW